MQEMGKAVWPRRAAPARRPTPCAAPSKGEARRAGAARRRQDAADGSGWGTNSGRGRTPRPPCRDSVERRRSQNRKRSRRGCSNVRPGRDHAGEPQREELGRSGGVASARPAQAAGRQRGA
jgi:hypothetical protein